MIQTFRFTKYGLINTYLYDKHYTTREPLIDNDTTIMANMWYIPIFGFELSKLRNCKINSAVLRFEIKGKNYPLEVELTSVSDDWNGDYVTHYEKDRGTPWAVDKWASDVIMSNGHSFYFREKTTYDSSTGMMSINVPVDFIYAMINGQSYGIGVVDVKSKAYAEADEDCWHDECWLASKKININPEKGKLPELEIDYEPAVFTVPEGVTDLRAAAVEDRESIDNRTVVLNWSKKPVEVSEYRYYRIYMSEKEADIKDMEPVPKYMVPNYDAAARFQGTEISHLKPDTDYWFAVTVCNNGCESKPEYVKVHTMAALKMPGVVKRKCLPVFSNVDGLSTPTFSVYAVDELAKVNPVNAAVLEKAEDSYECGTCGTLKDYDNVIFDGTRVILNGVPGEKLAFQFIVENKLSRPQDFKVNIDRKNLVEGFINLHKVWYLKVENAWYAEAAVPLEPGQGFTVPFAENRIPGQRYQSIFVDVELPSEISEGLYCFSVEFSAEGASVTIPVEISVHGVKLDRPDFKLELNGYVATPEYMGIQYHDKDFEAVEKEYYIAAFRHNMTVNILGYTHFGTIQEGFSPKIEFVDGLPRVTDWSEWDTHFEKYLNGSYLEDIFGFRVPVTHMYLPIFENWPMPINEYYKPKTDIEDYPQIINDIKLKTTTVAEDFLPGYREGIKAVLKDFIRHIDEKGWKDVQFQYFFNNKHFYKEKGHIEKKGVSGTSEWLVRKTCGNDGKATSWWLLDEPVFRDDWEAIAYFGSILKEAQREMNSGYNIKFRVDISGYTQMFNFLDGVLDVAIINGRVFNAREDLMRERKIKYGEEYWVYGCWNNINRTNMDSVIWIIDAWLKGGTGLVPWNNYTFDESYEKPTDIAAFYPGNRFGLKKPVVSLRMKAGRKALEMLKYLETFKKAFGYSDLQMKVYVSNFLKLKGETLSRYMHDAGLVEYALNSYKNMEELKLDIIRNLLARKA